MSPQDDLGDETKLDAESAELFASFLGLNLFLTLSAEISIVFSSQNLKSWGNFGRHERPPFALVGGRFSKPGEMGFKLKNRTSPSETS